jgi:acyl carrier protein
MTEPTVAKWNENSVLDHLKEIAREQLGLTPDQLAAIEPDAPVLVALRLDSLAQVVLMAAVENDFGCTFEPEELEKIQSVRDLVSLILMRVGTETVH